MVLLASTLAYLSLAQPLQPNATSLRIKTANVNGNLDFTVAEFGFQFSEPIYFQYPAPCPAGRCPLELQQAYIDENPCSFMACDFTLKGADCGKARLPECESLCAAQRDKFCPPIQDWIVLELGIETKPIEVDFRWTGVNLRVNFDRPCKALVAQITSLWGGDGILLYDVDNIAPTTDDCCQFAQQPPGFNAICPSAIQCYRYGTYFLRLRTFIASDLVTVRVFALDIEDGPQRTQSLPDAPPMVYPDPDFPFHIPLQWSVPFTYTYPGDAGYVPVLVSSYYCGFVTLQVNLDAYDPNLNSELIFVLVSTDPMNPFPSSISSDMHFIYQPTVKIHICQLDPTLPPARVFALVVRNNGAALGTPGTVTITADYDREGLIPPMPPQKAGNIGTWSNSTTWPAVNWYGYGAGLKISCPNATMTCLPGCEKFGCCENTWPAYPTSPSLQPLYPVPYPLRYRNEGTFGSDFAYLPGELDPYRTGVAMVLEQNFGGSIKYGPMGPNWRELLPQCTVSPGISSMGTLDGRWISGSFQPQLIEQDQCNYERFSVISHNMDKIFDLFVQPDPDDIGTARPLSLRYRADILTVLDDWIDCREYVDHELLQIKTVHLTADHTKICPEYSEHDPCCNPSLAWNECCIPRSLEFELEISSDPVADFNQQCQQSQCSLPILQSYVEGNLIDAAGGCEPTSLQTPSQVTTQAISAFARCLEASFGNDFEGIACHTDGECPSDSCDLVAHICRGNISALTRIFVSCVVDTVPPAVRLSLIENQGWIEAAKTTPVVDLIVTAFSQPFCIRRNHPIAGTRYRTHYRSTTGPSTCPPGNYLSLTRSTNPPVWAGTRITFGASCGYEFGAIAPSVDKTVCEVAEMICNDGSFNGCPAGGFCGVCETPQTCAAVALTQQACSGQACILADGSIVTGLSEAECSQRFSCTQAGLISQSSCETQGQCLDREDVYYLLENTYWAGAHSGAGICAFPMDPYAVPDCNVPYLGAIPTSYGCVRFGRCVQVGFPLECVVDYDQEITCQAAGGTWYIKPVDQVQCENPTLCNTPRYTGQRSAVWESNYQYLSQFPSQFNCEACGGDIRPVNKWIPHQWLPGQSRPLAWVERQKVPVYAFETSLDFANFSNTILKASQSTTAFQTLNALQCSYGNQKSQIGRLTCDCLDGLEREICFQQDAIAPIGQGRFCPFTGNRIVSPPFSIESTEASLTSDVQYQCIDFQISKIAAQIFDPPPAVSVTIAFKKRAQGQPQGAYATVFNAKEALVGSVVGDGIQIQFADRASAVSVRNFVLCETLPAYIVANLTLYPIYDFGRVDFSNNQIAVRPLHVETNYFSANNQICAIIALPGDLIVTYAPIVRLANDEAVEGVALTAGQQACLYVVASLFVVAALVWCAFLRQVYEAHKLSWDMPANVIWLCTMWIFVQRSIYLYLVSAGVLGLANVNQLVDFVMVDLPVCLYLVLVYQIGLSFLFLHLKPKDDMKHFWISFFAGAFLIMMLFVGVLLAYRYQVLDQPGMSGPILCPIYNDTTEPARIIRLIYEAIIVTMAVIIGFSEFVLGTSIYQQTADVVDSKRVLFLAVTASVGLVSDSVAWITYYGVDDPSPYFSIVLIFTEILPMVYLLFQLKSSAIKHGGSFAGSDSTGCPGVTTRSRRADPTSGSSESREIST